MIDTLFYAKLPALLKRSLNLAYLENGTYDQIVAHLERDLELSGLQNDGELTIPTMTAIPPNKNQQNTDQTKVTCHYCKKTRPRYPRLPQKDEKRSGPKK